MVVAPSWAAAAAAEAGVEPRPRGRPVGEGAAGGSVSRACRARGPRPRRTCLRGREEGTEKEKVNPCTS